jgi:hypothetical protein
MINRVGYDLRLHLYRADTGSPSASKPARHRRTGHTSADEPPARMNIEAADTALEVASRRLAAGAPSGCGTGSASQPLRAGSGSGE